MAIRTCPLCMSKNPAGAVVAYSDTLLCSQCGKPLEAARPSRLISTIIGLLAAFLVYRLARNSSGALGWVLPVVYSILVWAVVTPLVLLASADLRVRADHPYAEPHRELSSSRHAVHH